jgi:hypothetical protein
LPEIEGEKPSKKKFRTYPIGFVHIDIAEVRTEQGKLFLFIAIDRTSKLGFARVLEEEPHIVTPGLRTQPLLAPLGHDERRSKSCAFVRFRSEADLSQHATLTQNVANVQGFG